MREETSKFAKAALIAMVEFLNKKMTKKSYDVTVLVLVKILVKTLTICGIY
jgi:hypothetical protein